VHDTYEVKSQSLRVLSREPEANDLPVLKARLYFHVEGACEYYHQEKTRQNKQNLDALRNVQ